MFHLLSVLSSPLVSILLVAFISFSKHDPPVLHLIMFACDFLCSAWIPELSCIMVTGARLDQEIKLLKFFQMTNHEDVKSPGGCSDHTHLGESCLDMGVNM